MWHILTYCSKHCIVYSIIKYRVGSKGHIFLFHFGSTYCRKLNVQSFYSIPNSRIEQCLFGGLKGKVNSKSVRDQKIMIQRYVEFFWDIYYNLNSRTMIL